MIKLSFKGIWTNAVVVVIVNIVVVQVTVSIHVPSVVRIADHRKTKPTKEHSNHTVLSLSNYILL